MKERPFPMKAAEVRALLAGAKTQVRRLVKPQPIDRDGDGLRWSWPVTPDLPGWKFTVQGPRSVGEISEKLLKHAKPPYSSGDRLWVRETWGAVESYPEGRVEYVYRASHPDAPQDGGWTPSTRMPRWASRITLEVTGVRVERLKDISEEDAQAEGIQRVRLPLAGAFGTSVYAAEWPSAESGDTASAAFRALWESINGEDSWRENPWVWVLGIKRV